MSFELRLKKTTIMDDKLRTYSLGCEIINTTSSVCDISADCKLATGISLQNVGNNAGMMKQTFREL